MKKIFLIIYLLTFSFLYSEGQKIGYVDIQYIMSQNEDARLAHADVEKEANRLKVEYETKAILFTIDAEAYTDGANDGFDSANIKINGIRKNNPKILPSTL